MSAFNTVAESAAESAAASASMAAQAVTQVTEMLAGFEAPDVELTPEDVGLGNVDNTSDVAKPVSTAQGLADAAVATGAATDATTKAAAAQAAAATDATTKASAAQAAAATDATTKAAAAQAAAVQRANHTGEQTISTVTGLQAALDGKATSAHSHSSSTPVMEPVPRNTGALMIHPAGASTTTSILGFTYLTPMVLSNPINIDQVSFEITTAQGAGATVQIGYYTQNASGVLERQAVFGTVATDSTGVKNISWSGTLPAGPIWLAFSSTSSSGAFRAGSTAAFMGPMWILASSNFSATANGLRSAGAAASLPSTITPATAGDVAMPRYMFRKAA